MDEDLPARLAGNIKQLRDARGLTQQQMAKVSGLPRATWSNLESGAANPTMTVLHRVARALQVSLEELVATPRSSGRLFKATELPERTAAGASVRKLLPDPIPGMSIDRMELKPKSRFTGVPHTAGTREYLTCESGSIVLVVGGVEWRLEPGDLVTFRGDQKHSYANPGVKPAVGYSVVVLAPLE